MSTTNSKLRGLIPDDRTGKLRSVGLAISVVLLVLFPVFVTVGLFTPLAALKLAGALFFAVFAMSWDMASGYTGEISFGHALFFGIGGYTAGMLNVHAAIDPLIAIPLGAVVATAAGLLIGFPSLRLEGPYFSLITLVVPIILVNLFILYPAWTGGGRGLVAADTPRTIDKLTTIGEPIQNYLLALGLFLFTLGLFMLVTRSNTGEILTAVRENPEAVSAAGLNPAKYKLFAFTLSGFVGGLAGAIFVFSASGSAVPDSILSLIISIEVIVATVLGGIGTITGAALGGIIFFLLRDTLARMDVIVPVVGEPIGEMAFLVFGIIALLFLFFLPMGIVRAFWILVGRVFPGAETPDIAADGGRTTLWSIVESVEGRLRRLLRGENR